MPTPNNEEVLREIMNIVYGFGQLTTGYKDKNNLLPGQYTFISADQYEDFGNKLLDFYTRQCEEMRKEIERLNTVRCAYCGQSFPVGCEPTLIEKHIFSCEKHPVSQLTAELAQVNHELDLRKDATAERDYAQRELERVRGITVKEIANLIIFELEAGAWLLMSTYLNSGDAKDLAQAIHALINQKGEQDE